MESDLSVVDVMVLFGIEKKFGLLNCGCLAKIARILASTCSLVGLQASLHEHTRSNATSRKEKELPIILGMFILWPFCDFRF